ncbi:DUF4870 domain-containing protein [Solilutibacter pythonis]|nr:DUF4870 domain-containing protein [Lysobacter pythonis]
MDTFENSAATGSPPSQEARLWALGAHVGALIAAFATSWFAGVAGAAAALLVWFLVRERWSFASAHAKEAFNFNLSMCLYAGAAVLTGFLSIGGTVITLGFGALVTLSAGLLLLWVMVALAVAWLVFTVIAALKAWEGESYRYPLSIRLLR